MTIPLAKRLRFGASLGMAGVIIIILASFGAGSFYMTVVANPTVIDEGIDLEWNLKAFAILYFLAHIMGPCLLVFLLVAARDWMQHHGAMMAEGLFYIGLLSLGLWITSGTVSASLFPATPQIFAEPARQDDTLLFLRSFAAGLLDGAYWLLAIYSLPVAWFAWRRGPKLLGGTGFTVGLSMLFIALLGPFQKLNVLGVYGYGAPLFFLFALAATLLYQADDLEKNDTQSGG